MAELQERMSHAEFVEWMAFYQVEPFGGMRDDLHAALIVAMIANANRDPKKRKTPFEPGDFMPDWWGSKQRDDPGPAHAASLLAKFQMFAGAIEESETSGTTRDT